MHASRVERLFLTILVFGISLMLSVPAFAEKESDLSDVLGGIEWGDARKDVVEKIRSKGMQDLRADPKLKRDRILLQQERKRLLDRVETADKSFTRLEGERTGYEVSVIADEFSSNNGESFIRIKDKVAQRFYFFKDDRFYKLVVAYNPSYLRGVGFESFVGSSVKKYGRPAVADYDTIKGEEQLALVQWENPGTTLMVKNKKELFDTYTMSFADRQTLKRMASSGKALGGSDKDEDEVSASVQALMEEGDYDANSDVVDSLVGSTDVNLNAGRPKDDQVRRYSGGEDGKEVATAEAKEKKTKKSKKKKKTKKTKSKKAPDFGKLSTKASDDLIIY